MARKRIKSRPGLFGMTYYYDEYGRPMGKSRPGLLGDTRVYFDQNGRYAGWSRPGFLAKEAFVDRNNEYITSYDSFLCDAHFKNGRPMGTTSAGFFDCAYTTLDEEEDGAYDDCDDIWEQEDFSENDFNEPQGSGVKILCFLLLFVIVFVVIALLVRLG